MICLRSHSNGQSGHGSPGLLLPAPPTIALPPEESGVQLAVAGTGRQMGESVGKIPKEGFRAHEWEMPDNLSFLSEVTERGRIKCGVCGKRSPDTH